MAHSIQVFVQLHVVCVVFGVCMGGGGGGCICVVFGVYRCVLCWTCATSGGCHAQPASRLVSGCAVCVKGVSCCVCGCGIGAHVCEMLCCIVCVVMGLACVCCLSCEMSMCV